jgi:hypothetical protein
MSTITVTTVRSELPSVTTVRSTVVSTVRSPVIVSTGVATGPAGPAGASGSTDVTRTAGVVISGHRAVTEDGTGLLRYADNTTAADAWGPVGVSTNAAVIGDPVVVVRSGELTEPSWTWTPLGRIWLGVAGALTQTMPTAPAFLRVIGIATSATSMWVDPSIPVQLS